MAVDILGLIGPQGSGKDTVADMLVEMGGWKKISFADAVRECAWIINPIIIDEKIVGGFDDYQNLVTEYGYDKAKRLFPEVRRFLQVFGTDAVRNVIGETTWADLWLERAFTALDEGWRVVAADVRFETEIDALESAPGQSIIARVYHPSAKRNDSHASEAYESNAKADIPIYNNGDLDQLRATVSALKVTLESQDG